MKSLALALALALLSGCGYGPSAPIFGAARSGDVAAIRSLVAHGANPNERDDAVNHWTPLLHAVHKHQLGSVAALIDAGADPNGTDPNGTTPLIMAAGYGNTDMAELLLRRGANPHLADQHGATALDLALAGVPDIDRFTLFDCQNDTVRALVRADPTLLRHVGAPTPAARTWARLKGC